MAVKTYRSRRTVRARKVEDEHETVVTHRGPVSASRGDYVLAHDNSDVHVVSPEDFESSWEEVAEELEDASPETVSE